MPVEGYGQQARLPSLESTDIIPWERGGPAAPYPASVELSTLVAYIQSQVATGSVISFGSDRTVIVSPANGQVFFDTDDGIVYQYATVGSWTAKMDLVSSAELTTAIAGFLTQSVADARYVQSSALSESVDDRVAALLVAGTNTTLTYNDTANTLTIAASIPNETIDDRVAALLLAGSNISLTYDDTANTLTIASTATSSGGGATGIRYTLNTTAGTPAAGEIRSANLAVAGTIAISATDAATPGKSTADILARIKVGAIIVIAKSQTEQIRATVTTDYTTASGSFAVSTPLVDGAIGNGAIVFLSIASDASSGSATKVIITSNIAVSANNVIYFANSSSRLVISLPDAPAFPFNVGAIGRGLGGWQMSSFSSIKFNGLSGGTIRGDQYSTVSLEWTGLEWVVFSHEGALTLGSSPPFPLPSISSLSSDYGPSGSSFEIVGLNFVGISSVKIGAVEVSFTVNSPTSISAVIPSPVVSGLVSATNSSGTAQSPTPFYKQVFVSNFNANPPIDSVGHAITTGGSLTLNTAQFSSSPASLNFQDGWAQFLISSNEKLSADFSIRAWIYPTQINPNSGFIFCTRSVASGVATVDNILALNENSGIRFVIRNGESGVTHLDMNTGNNLIFINTAYFIEATVSGPTARIFINNVEVATSAIIGARSATHLYGTIGAFLNPSDTRYFLGSIDDVRILLG
jgi:hypothetical protein